MTITEVLSADVPLPFLKHLLAYLTLKTQDVHLVPNLDWDRVLKMEIYGSRLEKKEEHRRKVKSDIKDDKRGQGLNQLRSQFANLWGFYRYWAFCSLTEWSIGKRWKSPSRILVAKRKVKSKCDKSLGLMPQRLKSQPPLTGCLLDLIWNGKSCVSLSVLLLTHLTVKGKSTVCLLGFNRVFSVGIYIFHVKKNHTEPFEINSVTSTF